MNVIAKANNLVSKGSISDVVYVKNCLDEITKQLIVKMQHQDLFYSLFLKVLDRLFGEDVSGCSADASAVPPWVKGAPGGWLRELMYCGPKPLTEPSSGLPSSPNMRTISNANQPGRSREGVRCSYVGSVDQATELLLQKFTPFSSMFDILAKIQGGCELKLDLLPPKLQLFIADHRVYPVVSSLNHVAICHRLIRSPLYSHAQRSNMAQKGAVLLDSLEYFMILLMRYPTMSHNMLTPNGHSGYSDRNSSRHTPGQAAINAVSHSLHIKSSSQRHSLEALHNKGVRGWIEGVPYLVLLYEYMQEFIPRTQATSNSDHCVVSDKYDRSSVRRATADQEGAWQTYRELFLRLSIEYWIDTASIVKTDHFRVNSYRKMLTNTGSINQPAEIGDVGFPHQHPSPVEVVLLDSASLRWTVSTMQCTYLLVLQVLADPELLSHLSRNGTTFSESRSTSPGFRRNGFGFGDSGGQLSILGQQVSQQQDTTGRCGTEWQLFQPVIFNMLRCIFSKGDLSMIDRQVVVLAVELWLLWVQPWMAPRIAQSGAGGILRLSSNYTDIWQPYIAANLHFYTTLLACYFRMMSKMNLSVSEREGTLQLFMLNRVLRAFTPTLLHTVDHLTGSFSAWYPNQLSFAHHQAHSCLEDDRSFRSIHSTVGLTGSMGPGSPTGDGSLRHRSTTQYRDNENQQLKLQSEMNGEIASATKAHAAAKRILQSVPEEQLILMKSQHEQLFPDRRIDDLPDYGITDFRAYSLEACTAVVSSLTQMDHDLAETQGFAGKALKFVVEHIRKAGLDIPLPETGHKYADRLSQCVQGILQVVPASAAGLTTALMSSSSQYPGTLSASDTLIKQPGGTAERDFFSGRLTAAGRQSLIDGRTRCSVQDFLVRPPYIPGSGPLRSSEDPLENPLCTYEWAALAIFLIRVSRWLNSRYNLPKDKRWLLHPWSSIYQYSSRTDPAQYFITELVVNSFRFNLRFLARFRVFSLILLAVQVVLYRTDWVGLPVSLIAALAYIAIAYQGSFQFY